MARAIKFRAWNKKSKSWYKEGNIDDYYITLNGELKSYQCCHDGGWFDEGDYIIMEYTGLKDSEGKDIYEGDIVVNYAIIDSVVFEGGSFILSRDRGCPTCHSKYIGMHEDILIIGNIYENLEILEDKE